jgi:hypothetical protein
VELTSQSGSRTKCRSNLLKWGWGGILSLTCGLWVGHNTELPYIVESGVDLKEPKQQWSNTGHFLVKSETYLTTLENLVMS